MYIFLRLAITLVRSKFVPKLRLLDEVRSPVFIWPNDLDFNGHVNNGRYLTLFDLGRLDMTMRTGLWRFMVKKRWLPVLSTASIRFRKSIHAFSRMEITTQIIFYDEKWFFIEHRFERGGEVYARALVKGLFRGPEGNVPMAALLAALQTTHVQPPPMPAIVRQALALDEALAGRGA